MKHINHITHFEDLLLSEDAGSSKALALAQDILELLRGQSKTHISVSEKWDGAPSIFAGQNPSNGDFFVAKKSIFNKEPKVYKTYRDIEADITDENLVHKFKTVLDCLSRSNIQGVLQGDLLFLQKDIHEMEAMGKSYLAFHPNTIVYAIPKENKTAIRAATSKLGVAWHTVYRGSDFGSMSADFTAPSLLNFRETEEVWAVNPHIQHFSSISDAEYNIANELVLTCHKSAIECQTIQDPLAKLMIERYVNHTVKAENYLNEDNFIAFLKRVQEKEVEKLMTTKAKLRTFDKFQKCIQCDYTGVFPHYTDLIQVKLILLNLLEKYDHIHKFLNVNGNFRKTSHEGYVVKDLNTRSVIKLVDRNRFSYANFHPNVKKGWSKQLLEA